MRRSRLFTAALGLVLMIANLAAHDKFMFVGATLTFLGGVACAYLAWVKKDRERAKKIVD